MGGLETIALPSGGGGAHESRPANPDTATPVSMAIKNL